MSPRRNLIRDIRRKRVYRRGGKPHPASGDDSASVDSQLPLRRRRRPSPTEQKRREEWGRMWGQLVKHATQGIREDGG